MEQIFLIIFYWVILVYSIILHEVSHGVVALWLGDKTAKYAGRLSLEPMRHIDWFGSIVLPFIMIMTTGFAFGWAKPVPYNPYNLKWPRWGSVVVAFAGPITNFLIAFVAAVIGAIVSVPIIKKQEIIEYLLSADWSGLTQSVIGSPLAIVYAVCAMAIFWNVLLGTFNLMPIPPLDGSKLLFQVLKVKPQTQMFLEQWGFFIILILFMVPVFSVPFRFLLMSLWQIFFSVSLL